MELFPLAPVYFTSGWKSLGVVMFVCDRHRELEKEGGAGVEVVQGIWVVTLQGPSNNFKLGIIDDYNLSSHPPPPFLSLPFPIKKRKRK